MPSEGDLILYDSGPLGSRTSLCEYQGRFLGEFPTLDQALRAAKGHMERERFWPDLWYQDDHGGLQLVNHWLEGV